MKQSQWMKLGVIGVSCLLLTACGLWGKKSATADSGAAVVTADNGVSPGDGNAQTFAGNGAQTFQGQSGDDNASNPGQNAVNAPENQTYYFGFDQSGIGSDDMPAIKAQAEYLVNHPAAKVRLAGNTDNRGSREYNVALGWRRDQAVSRIMAQAGVSPRQIDMVSYGKERPAVMGDNEAAWALNRRVNLVYEAK